MTLKQVLKQIQTQENPEETHIKTVMETKIINGVEYVCREDYRHASESVQICHFLINKKDYSCVGHAKFNRKEKNLRNKINRAKGYRHLVWIPALF